jgi:hypothetical protein
MYEIFEYTILSLKISFYSFHFNKLEAQKARDEYNSAKTEVDNLQSSVDALKATLGYDYGEQFEFYHLKNICLSLDMVFFICLNLA